MVDMVEKGAKELMKSEEEKKRLAEEAEAVSNMTSNNLF